MTLIEMLRAWLQAMPVTAGYGYSLGAWSEDAGTGKVIALWNDGGREVVEEDYPVFRIVLVGRRDTRVDAVGLIRLAGEIREAAKAAGCMGDTVRVKPIGGIVGPGYTAEGRAWVELSLEFLV